MASNVARAAYMREWRNAHPESVRATKRRYWDANGDAVNAVRRALAAKPLVTVEERFWAKVDRPTAEGCWYWRASRIWNGYGHFKLDGSARSAHRVAWELTNGPIPDGLHTDHLCGNRACVNPAHIELVTPAENARRAVRLREMRRAATRSAA